MTLSVRIPPRVEQELAEYCSRHRMSKSEAVKLALERLLADRRQAAAPYDLLRDLVGPETDARPQDDIARHTKRLLRERFRPGGR